MSTIYADPDELVDQALQEEDEFSNEDLDLVDELDGLNEVRLGDDQTAWVNEMVETILAFCQEFCGKELFPYQREMAYRIIESLVINDGEEITGLWARQSGKSETVSVVISGCMVLFPKLAKAFPDWFGKYENGLLVGVFAPVDEMAITLHSRVVDNLTSDRATEFLLDPELDDKATARGTVIKLKSGSLCRRQTANPRAKIESKSYHLVLIDECQDADDYVISKSIHPMMAFYNGTIVKTGTPNRTKGHFYKAIQRNKRRQTKKSARQNHFQFDWRYASRYNPNYEKFIRKEMVRIGVDSDEFQLSYELKWLLDRGMFITEHVFDSLGDVSMEIVQGWWHTPVVVGVDPARRVDSTVVTVAYVDWDRPDEFGFYHHRVLNWLELAGEEWESQYFQIIDFLKNYNVHRIGVDANGVGDAVAERLSKLMPNTEVIALDSGQTHQSDRWKHLSQLIDRRMVTWPANARARRLKRWQRFRQQMTDATKLYKGPHMVVEAPDESDAHDDYPDSLACAAAMTMDLTMPEVMEDTSPFYR